jgi:hypothetical protein
MQGTFQDLRYFFIPLILAAVLTILDQSVSLYYLSKVVNFGLAVLSGQISEPTVKLCFFATLGLVSLKLSFGSLAQTFESNQIKLEGVLAFFFNTFVTIFSIITGMLLGFGAYQFFGSEMSNTLNLAWGFYCMLLTLGFMFIIEMSLSTYKLAVTSFFKDNGGVVRGLGYITLVVTIYGVTQEII